jgi:hypothetical protein
MTYVTIKHADPDQTETVELAGAGHVRVEIDAEGGLISRLFHPGSVVGVEYADDPKPKSKK